MHSNTWNPRRRAAVGLLAGSLAVGGVVLLPTAAQAATGVAVGGNTLIVEAAAGQANDFQLSLTNDTLTVIDHANVLPVGNGCVSINRQTAECDVSTVTLVRITAGDLDDTVLSAVPLATTVNAGAGNDTVTTGSRDDTLNGGDDTDVLTGGAGADSLNGGAGTDTLAGEAGRDTMVSGNPDGADTFSGGADTDTADYSGRTAALVADLDGTADDGESGEKDNLATDVEEIKGGSAADTLTGSDLATVTNRLLGGPGADTLTGFAGRDVLVGNEGSDTMVGGEGNDDFYPNLGQDTMAGGNGRDEVFYSERTARVEVTLDGTANDGEIGEGDNVGADFEDVNGSDGPNRLVGNGADNTLIGGPDRDILLGQGGLDFLGGESGDDRLDGGTQDDTVNGQSGNDTLIGGPGSDHLNGGDEDDTLFGGNDVAPTVQDGADDMTGGTGFDTVDYSDHGGIAVSVSLDEQANDGTTGQNEGDNAGFSIERVIGGSGGDFLVGNDEDNTLIGGKFGTDGADQLFGRGGVDQVLGSFGNDTLDCGAGSPDVGDGGPGTDQLAPFASCEITLNLP